MEDSSVCYHIAGYGRVLPNRILEIFLHLNTSISLQSHNVSGCDLVLKQLGNTDESIVPSIT